LDVADFTQAGRYVAAIDTITPTGGQLSPRLLEFDDKGKLINGGFDLLNKSKSFVEVQNPDAPTVVRVVNVGTSPGSQVFVTIAADAQGTENGFGFTLNYDQTKLSSPLVTKGADTQNATLIPNTQQAGRVGVVLGMPFGEGIGGGTRHIVTIRFNVAPNAPGGLTALTFGSMPVVQSVSDINANSLQSNFQDGAINILGPTGAGVSINGRVVSKSGRGLSRAQVSITDASGEKRYALVSPSGYYRFDDVVAGETYIISVIHKGVRFNPSSIIMTILEDTTNVNFVSEN
jgi:hypothetical protein